MEHSQIRLQKNIVWSHNYIVRSTCIGPFFTYVIDIQCTLLKKAVRNIAGANLQLAHCKSLFAELNNAPTVVNLCTGC